jgi:hypothetical protein
MCVRKLLAFLHFFCNVPQPSITFIFYVGKFFVKSLFFLVLVVVFTTP